MPRDGSGNYILPAGTDGVPGEPVESAPYNLLTGDIELDLNTPRPIIAGGTGASSAAGALAALSGETATQVVTNFATHVFLPGSFAANNSATGGPVAAHNYTGIAYLLDANNLIIEARDLDDTANPGRRYVRQKKAGSWGAWAAEDPVGTNGLLLLSAVQAGSQNAVAFTSLLTNAYEKYIIEVVDLWPENNGAAFAMQFSGDNGAGWIASGYSSHAIFGDMTANTVAGSGVNGTGTGLNVGVYLMSNQSIKASSVTVELFNPAGLKDPVANWRAQGFSNNANFFHGVGAGTRVGWGAAAMNAVRFTFSTGNIASGKFKLYGMKK